MNEIALRQSADKINKWHNGIDTVLKRTVQDAINIGAELSKVKDEVGHGNFIDWINNNCCFTRMNANRYIKLNKYREKCNMMLHLSDAYKKIDELEWAEKNADSVKKAKERQDRVSQKFAEAPKPDFNADDFFKKKEKTFDDTKFQQIKEQLEKEIKEEEAFKRSLGVTDCNKNQEAFFDVISRYCNGLGDDNERREALHNIIKYCKKKIIEYETR